MILIAPPKLGFNNYKIEGDITILYLTQRDGNTFEALIDTDELEGLKELGLHWHAQYADNIDSYYVKSTIYRKINGKRKGTTLYLSKYIMPCEKGYYVDHINHNTLDNRKCNLKVISGLKNSINRKSANKNNSTGYRNVCYIKREGKYIVQLQINGKNTKLGDFDDIDEAGKFAEEMRKKYYNPIYNPQEYIEKQNCKTQ